MPVRELFAAATGSWHGTKHLLDPHNNLEERCDMAVTAMATPEGGRLAYEWSFRGKPQKGVIDALQSVPGLLGALWTDTWHTNNQPMVCQGVEEGDRLSVRGTYAAPPGPDWGWKMDLFLSGEELRIVMWNVWPQEQGGKEELAVEASLTRVT